MVSGDTGCSKLVARGLCFVWRTADSVQRSADRFLIIFKSKIKMQKAKLWNCFAEIYFLITDFADCRRFFSFLATENTPCLLLAGAGENTERK